MQVNLNYNVRESSPGSGSNERGCDNDNHLERVA